MIFGQPPDTASKHGFCTCDARSTTSPSVQSDAAVYASPRVCARATAGAGSVPDRPGCVLLDTNHLERALRAILMGRKSWNFCWTELGAKHVGIAQSLVVTCRLLGIDPYTYLVDVLQRVGQHPALRLWRLNFADNPLRSDLYHR